MQSYVLRIEIEWWGHLGLSGQGRSLRGDDI